MKNENLSEWNEHDIFIVTSLSENLNYGSENFFSGEF